MTTLPLLLWGEWDYLADEMDLVEYKREISFGIGESQGNQIFQFYISSNQFKRYLYVAVS